MKQGRQEKGRFASKSDEYRAVRSLRLTEATWEALGITANSRCITRADLIEELVETGTLNSDRPTNSIDLQRLEQAVTEILNDPAVTRNGKDRGSVRRALNALLKALH